MALPAEQLMLVDSAGRPVEVDGLIEQLRGEPQRVLADDEVGVVVYVGDLGIYSLKPTESGAFLAQPVTEISRPRFSTRVEFLEYGEDQQVEDTVLVAPGNRWSSKGYLSRKR
jgi:hypothetical protein